MQRFTTLFQIRLGALSFAWRFRILSRDGTTEGSLSSRGRDIYAITVPIVGEATERILDGRFKATGVVAAGEIFDAQDFLRSLQPTLSIETQ